MPKTLDFLFTPGDPAKEGAENPHAKSTTKNPELIESLKAKFGDAVQGLMEYANEQTVYIAKSSLLEVMTFLKNEKDFDYLIDLAGIDRFTEEDRFEIFYNLVSVKGKMRIRIKTRIDEEDLKIDSLCSVYRSADWHERECYDMLGIVFNDHPDLRRMYLPEDFEHFPLRKEFPNLGIPGSLPLPSQTDDGAMQSDPFIRAHGQKPEHGTPFSE